MALTCFLWTFVIFGLSYWLRSIFFSTKPFKLRSVVASKCKQSWRKKNRQMLGQIYISMIESPKHDWHVSFCPKGLFYWRATAITVHCSFRFIWPFLAVIDSIYLKLFNLNAIVLLYRSENGAFKSVFVKYFAPWKALWSLGIPLRTGWKKNTLVILNPKYF